MIRETTTNLDPKWGELIDVDVLASGDWAGLFREGGRLYVRTARNCVPISNAVRYPLIRCLEPERVVLVDGRTIRGRVNAWILSITNGLVSEFFAGDGIEDVLATVDTIVVTYFDEGIFRNIPPGYEGVAIFTSSGEFRAGYHSALTSNAVKIANCDAACWESDLRIAFFPYTEYPLVSLDIRTLEQKVVATPQRVHGSSAIAVSQGRVLFFDPFDDENAIFEWKPGGRLSMVGLYPGPLRGLRGGRFLAHGTSGFTIIETEAVQPANEDDDTAAGTVQ